MSGGRKRWVENPGYGKGTERKVEFEVALLVRAASQLSTK
jgi:hypothetical protein